MRFVAQMVRSGAAGFRRMKMKTFETATSMVLAIAAQALAVGVILAI
ncbi:hypothetical protein [Sphingomonas oleivorans]|nr:hypothetical protein [Sphingomonas oleivorans]